MEPQTTPPLLSGTSNAETGDVGGQHVPMTQLSAAMQLPQSSMSPQPLGIGPHFAPSAAHVVATQAPPPPWVPVDAVPEVFDVAPPPSGPVLHACGLASHAECQSVP
jgi:hypothetical protein